MELKDKQRTGEDTNKKKENPEKPELDFEFVESVEKSKMELDDKINFLLTKGGLKPASIIELPIRLQTQEEVKEFFKENEIDEIIELVKKSGLECHIGEKRIAEGSYRTKDEPEIERHSKGEHRDIFIASSKEKLDALINSWYTEDQEAIGKALGFPTTAVEAFVGKREAWFDENIPNEIRESDAVTFLTPTLSKDNWQEEMKEGDKRARFIKKNSPKIYAEIMTREALDRKQGDIQVGVESDGLRMQREDQKKIDEEKIEEVRNRLDLPNEENKPEKLYRAYTLNPEDLSVEKFQEILVPMNVNEKDPTKVNDGNELGVYMSTNENMVKYAYSDGIAFIEDLHIEAPRHNDGRGIVNYIKLPSCGVIVEVDTKNLSIKKPEITQYLQGVYNNGFEGDEWIADKIPPSNYKVKKLILNIGSSGLDKIEIEVDGLDNQKLKEAIEFIKNKFNQKKQEAILYKKFLESISERERMSNKFYLESKWKKYQEENKETEEELTN